MKTAYIHCILEMDVFDKATKDGVKNRILEIFNEQDIAAHFVTVEFDENED